MRRADGRTPQPLRTLGEPERVDAVAKPSVRGGSVEIVLRRRDGAESEGVPLYLSPLQRDLGGATFRARSGETCALPEGAYRLRAPFEIADDGAASVAVVAGRTVRVERTAAVDHVRVEIVPRHARGVGIAAYFGEASAVGGESSGVAGPGPFQVFVPVGAEVAGWVEAGGFGRQPFRRGPIGAAEGPHVVVEAVFDA